ncbi:MATE family efflux transporter [Alphaproteobacteria bacterium]|nr:MATE family efflux transporter [Alphaproteobacteria bacterium]
MEHKAIDCSLKSILNVTIPMVLSVMSVNLMYVMDKVMLAGYSIDAMNAVALSSSFVMIFTYTFIGMSDTAEIFVGQYNGAKNYEQLASPAWQMIYLSLLSNIIFVPIAYFSDHINTLPPYYFKEGIEYQKILMYFGMIPAAKVALSAFFVGQGKTKIISISVAIGTLTNFALDYFLIYGVGNVIPAMGGRGAAIATVIAELLQVIILASLFFGKNNREIYKTLENCKFNWKLFLSCLKIGTPMALGNSLALVAWYILQTIMSYVSKDVATIYNIGLNVYIFFIFVGEGINKATATICSNMIGRGDLESIEKTRKIFVAISLFFGFLVAIPLVCFPEWVMIALDMLPDNVSMLYSDIKTVFYLVTVAVVLETIMLSTWGILMAGGDTKYTTIVYQVCLWTLIILPTIVLYCFHALNSVPVVYGFMVAWLIATQFFIYQRYKSLKWYNKLV